MSMDRPKNYIKTRNALLLMISRTLQALAFLLPLGSIGQSLPDSIIINYNTYIQSYSGGDTLYRVEKYAIIRHGSHYRLNNKSINKNEIIGLLQELTVPSNSTNSLTKYGIDTTWIKKNPEQLLKLYPGKGEVEWNKEQRTFLYNKLTNIKDHQRQLNSHLRSGCCYSMHNSYRNQFQLKTYINGNLVENMYSRKRISGYFYPWTNSKTDTLYNFEIESKLNRLLSLKRKIKAPMSGTNLLDYLVKNTVDNNMQALYKLSAYSYLNEINELKSDFEIVSFEEVYGRGRYIWNEPKTMKIQLTNKSMLQNVTLCFLASKQGNTIYSRDSIKKEYKTIIDRVQSIDFIKNYLTQNPKSKLDIYYFNNNGINAYNIENVNKSPEAWLRHEKYVESLQWYEKTNTTPGFDLDDAIRTSQQIDCGCNYRFDQAYIKQAIFFEIVDEYGNNSIWFLLPDNKVLLYLMEGDRVLNYNSTDFGITAHLDYPCVLFDGAGQQIRR
jgi:hypothetical protein